MNTPITKPRKPWLAALLSCLCWGVGHVYCGRIATGLVLLLIGMSAVPMASLGKIYGYSSGWYTAFLISLGVSAATSFYSMIASYRLANRIGPDYELRDYNRPIVYVALILAAGLMSPIISIELALTLRDNVAEAFVCPAESMLPNIINGDRFLADKRAYVDSRPDYGDIIVFLNPEDRSMNFVKRVIGLPGDHVEVRGGRVYVNGEELPQEPTANSAMGPGEIPNGAELFYETNGDRRYLLLRDTGESTVADYPETTVPADHVFVLGDHRDHSKDSRKIGFIPLLDVKGRATFLYWPAGRWTRFGELR
jgi:signal peptidase I